LLSESTKEEIGLRIDSGTILDALNVRNIPRLRFLDPGAALLEQFEVLARPLRTRMEDGLTQSRIVATLRDTLLPKLISGELRIRDAERLVGKVT
jgi:type I restriction enzyme S subunit